MKIVIENHIPYVNGLFEPWASVEYLPYQEITAAAVAQADALVVRTRTRCDAQLLDDSRCSLVATATIGTDHIDLPYCRRRGIAVCNAPGCNAPAVAQYVHATIGRLIGDPRGLAIGIVGVGHVGSIVARWAVELGMRVLLCDPPRERAEAGFNGCTLSEVARQADIITFHTPFTRTGADATWHLCDKQFVEQLAHCQLLINSARGPVTDTAALLYGLDRGLIANVAIDCWENEPCIDPRLLERAAVATPHIAGYSQEGKMRATAMVVEAINRHFGLNAKVPAVSAPAQGAAAVTIGRITASYNPLLDTQALKSAPQQFEQQRNQYPLRPEVQ